MVSAQSTPGTVELPPRVIAGVVAGVVGGVVGGIAFGVVLQLIDFMPMIAQLIGGESVGVGWLVHLFNAALFGAIFAVLSARWASTALSAAGLGLVYGVLWWVLGALLIMPAWLGMNEMIFQVGTDQWWSLIGHLIYGLLLGLVYVLLLRRAQRD